MREESATVSGATTGDPAETTPTGMIGWLTDLLKLARPAVPKWLAQDLTFGQLRLLFHLKRNGGTKTMSGIAEWLGVTLPTATGIVERVERHGLVERRHRLDDRRIVDCALTPAAEELLGEILGIRDEALRRAFSLLTDEERAELDSLFARIHARLQAQAAGPEAEPAIEPREPR